jgi:hypothetical protein
MYVNSERYLVYFIEDISWRLNKKNPVKKHINLRYKAPDFSGAFGRIEKPLSAKGEKTGL